MGCLGCLYVVAVIGTLLIAVVIIAALSKT